MKGREHDGVRSELESYKYDPMNEKHRMSVSSLSGASSHAFLPSSVETSTLDSSEIPIIHVETYVADPAYVVHRENQTKNNTITEIEEPAQFPKVKDVGEDTSALMTCIHEKVEDMAKDTKFQDHSISNALGNDIAVPATDCNNSNRSSSIIGASSHAFHPSSVGTSTLDSSEIPIIHVETYVADPAYVVHRENQTKNNTITEIEEPAQFPKVKDVGEDTSALMTCIHEKVEDVAKDTSTSIDPCVETTYVIEAQLDATSEGEFDQTSSSSSNASQSSVSQRTEHNIEEFQDPSVSPFCFQCS
nr:hypothetical protein [Tanacetum cinerariifolium]